VGVGDQGEDYVIAKEPKPSLWLAPLLSQVHPGLPRLTHSSGYSSNCSGPRTEMESAHVEIPISNYLFQANSKNSVSQHGRDLAVKLEREIENRVIIIFYAVPLLQGPK
jgi:hypothetical protein